MTFPTNGFNCRLGCCTYIVGYMFSNSERRFLSLFKVCSINVAADSIYLGKKMYFCKLKKGKKDK